MPRGAKVVAVVLFLAGLLAVCGAKGEMVTCRPSSCGEIGNISHPFRLENDPPGCGYAHYELVCENNRTVVYLPDRRYYNNSWGYYVADINYKRHTIRVVDAGLEKGNCFSTPLHSLTRDLIGYYYSPYHFKSKGVTNTILLMNCEEPRNDRHYIPITPCSSSNLTPSSSSQPQPYVYALVGEESMAVGDIEYNSCTMGMTIIIQFLKPGADNVSMSDLQEAMLLGLDLSFSSKKRTILQILYAVLKKIIVPLLRVDYFIRDFQNLLRYILSFRAIIGSGTVLLEVAIRGTRVLLQFIVLIMVGRTVLGILCMLAYLAYKFRRRHLSLDGIEEFLHRHQNLQPIKYSFSEIKKMTHNFKDKLGQGGFGSVYKGQLRSGRTVAIKMLFMSKANGEDFINGVATIGMIHHVNIVKLVGFCIERSKWALIYDFMPNGSLDKFVFHDRRNINPLSWETLYKIALGVGRGINYLHQGCDMQILHFDIKPHNILLDKDFTPKVSDFGLAKLYSMDESIVSITAARGTLGYMAPELFYKNIGGISFKADVYSFGMLLLEIVGKRKNVNAFAEHSSQIYFPTWIYDKYDQGEEIVFEEVTMEERKFVKKMVIVALWCIQMKPIERPSMSKVLEMLEDDVELLKMPPKPTLWPIESPRENHEQSMMLAPITSSIHSIGSITLNGR